MQGLARANENVRFSVGTNVGSTVAFFIHQPQHRIITFASPVKSHDIVKQTQKTYVTYDGPCHWNKIIYTFDPLWKAPLRKQILDQCQPLNLLSKSPALNSTYSQRVGRKHTVK
jgi:hypothetical protein